MSSYKLFFLVFLLTVAVCHGATCKTDADCAPLPDICAGDPPFFLICMDNHRCGCHRYAQKQQLNSQENAPLQQTRKLLNM
ncbi:hypothetical protein Lalb_Chr19g0133051 [Lupinus albus]|uniref:Late nodulin n=1 Tax=Lupinus albus TaxID=3870 RepID=A0A6A4NUP5_LUPAL|nr:hypothetical protein Lalb_Chr19g0133051 [Lupinus albus]